MKNDLTSSNDESDNDDDNNNDGENMVNKIFKNIKLYKIKGDGIYDNSNNIICCHNNTLKARYKKNGKNLNNKLLKHDYKVTNRFQKAFKTGKGIERLSDNEQKVLNETIKYIDKIPKNFDILYGSYVSGNVSKSLFNILNKLIYEMLKNKQIDKLTYNKYLKNIISKVE